MPELGRDPRIKCFDNIRDLAAGRERQEPSGSSRNTALAPAVLGRSTFPRVLAVLVVISMLSTIIPGVVEHEPVGRAAAATGVFTNPVMVNNNKANDQAAPVSIVASGDDPYVVWQDSRSGNEDIYASVSTDNGTTFPANKRADDAVGSSKQIEPATAVSANGTIMLAWQDNRRSTYDFDIYFTKSYDVGNKYASNIRVDDSFDGLSWQERPSISIAANGVVCVAWTDDRTGPGEMRVRYAYSEDGGETFSRSAEIVADGSRSGQTGVSLTANGNRVFAVFLDNVTGTPHPYLSISLDGGKTFRSPTRIDDTGSAQALQNGLSIAPMPGGGIAVVWEDTRNGDWDIYASVISADGKALVSNVRVDDDSTKSYQRGACVASDQLGNVYAVWEDDRDLKFAIRFAYLEAWRTRFSASIEVATPGGNDMQRRPSVVSTSPGRVFVIWQDDKSGTYDVYSSTAYFRNLFGISLVKGWNFVSIPTTGFAYNASTLGLKTGDIVTRWNPLTRSYDKTYVCGVSPPSQDFAIADSTGYWIAVGSEERILLNGSIPTAKQYRQISVPAGGGWVTVGFESLSTAMYASNIPRMLSTAGSISMVLSYNPLTQTYKAYVPGLPATDFGLVPGQGYWCVCGCSGAFTYTP